MVVRCLKPQINKVANRVKVYTEQAVYDVMMPEPNVISVNLCTFRILIDRALVTLKLVIHVTFGMKPVYSAMKILARRVRVVTGKILQQPVASKLGGELSTVK